jgi:hypothetical protein
MMHGREKSDSAIVDPMQARRTESATVLGINPPPAHREILMEARVVTNLSPAAAHDGAVRCLLAIELS